ncbi:MAG: hypothetical protein WD492_11535 [Alkalispirochaeta sp.]
MSHVVRVFVPPVGECAGENTWENAGRAMEARLRRVLTEDVQFETVHLFSPEFFAHPEVTSLVQNGEGTPPIVTLDGRVIQSGGKLRERLIREELQKMEQESKG